MIILVGYASAHGSTREIAERVGERLRDHDLAVDVRELARVDDPQRYDAFVLGSAIHSQRWLPEALGFLAEHAPHLAAKPVWIFSVGMAAALRWPLRLGVGPQSAVVSAGFAGHVSYRDHPVFAGVVRDDHFPLLGRLLVRLTSRGPGDYRDWARIDSWADGIARVLTTLPAATPRWPGPPSADQG